MFGFVIGTLSLIGLIKLSRWQRWGGGYGYGGGGYGGRGGGPRNWMLRRLFQRLDTTPGQEKVIAQAFDTLREKAQAFREGAFASKADVAKAVSGEHFDAETVRDAFAKHEVQFDSLKNELIAQMQKIHEALNPEQRKQIGQLIEYGPRAFAGGHGGGCGHGRFGGHGHWRHAGGRGGDSMNI
jgi:Spy/CpxP family protein refolding chaperone